MVFHMIPGHDWAIDKDETAHGYPPDGFHLEPYAAHNRFGRGSFGTADLGVSHGSGDSTHLTRLRWRPLTGTTLPSA